MRVNVEGKALTDPRFKALANELGITWMDALGRCIAVWALAYERRRATMPERHIDAAAETKGFARAMVAAELARDVPGGVPGGVRLAGVTEGVQWLLVQDAKRQKALAAKRRAAGMVEDVPDASADVPGDVPQDVPISPALALDPTPERESPARAIHIPSTEPAPPPSEQIANARSEAPPPAIAAPIARTPSARMGPVVAAADWLGLGVELWAYAAKAYGALVTEGVDAKANPDVWNGMPRPILTERTRDMREAGLTVEQARRRFHGAIATATATARRKRTLQWLTPSTFLRRDSFDRDADATAAQVTASANQAPPRSSDGEQLAPGSKRVDDEPTFSAFELARLRAPVPPMTAEEKQAKLDALRRKSSGVAS